MLVLEHTFYKLYSAWMLLKSNVNQIPADSTEFSFQNVYYTGSGVCGFPTGATHGYDYFKLTYPIADSDRF